SAAASAPDVSGSGGRVDVATAERAFQVLAELDAAWARRDCAAVAELTTGVEKTLGGRACEATRNGRPALHGDPMFFLPEAGDWFAALARKPTPAYFVFQFDGGRWRLAAGPVPAHGPPVEPAGHVTAGRSMARQARLVPQRHLTYLTDPAGVNGVRFPSGDPVRGLLEELTGRPAQVAPDRLSIDVELVEEPARTVALSADSVLVFDALRIRYEQRPRPGRTSLRHPLDGLSPAGSELVVLVSVISAADGLATVGLRRGLAG
ncbi:hypothetical protein, partial [Nonomuraea lactucae]|uniref:hypothetical protein n=1 Tax=Nonomuraea lactucae TaxID=2249762 RepID=UPI0013B3CD37